MGRAAGVGPGDQGIELLLEPFVAIRTTEQSRLSESAESHATRRAGLASLGGGLDGFCGCELSEQFSHWWCFRNDVSGLDCVLFAEMHLDTLLGVDLVDHCWLVATVALFHGSFLRIAIQGLRGQTSPVAYWSYCVVFRALELTTDLMAASVSRRGGTS